MPSTVTSTASTWGGKSSSRLHMDLNDLLDRSQQLLPATDNFIQKDLESIHEQSKKLIQKTARGDVQSKGDYLLAANGFDVEKYRRSVSRLDLKQAFEPLEPIGETDIEGYLKHEHDMILLSSIEESKRHTSNCFYKNFNDYLEKDWALAKDNLIKTLDLHKTYHAQAFRPTSTSMNESFLRNTSRLTPSSSTFNVPSTPFTPLGPTPTPHLTPRRGKTNMDERMIAYSEVIYKFNESLKKDTPFELIRQFSEVAHYIDEPISRKREVVECWKLLSFMIDESKSRHSQSNLLEGAKRYMEESYIQYVKDTLELHEEVKDNLRLIKAFVSKTLKHADVDKLGECVDGVYIWPVLFYCLRCGFLQEALDFAREYCSAFSNHIINALENKMNTQMASIQDVENQLNEKYRTIPPTELFRHAVYLVLGRCDVKKTIPQVFSKTEDFMWLKLSIIREGTKYALKDLQTVVNNHGPKHFCPKKNSLLFFRLLLSTLQFEKAIEYLCSRQSEGYHVEAVHFAYALYYYKQLTTPKDLSVPLLVATPQPQLNFYFLIRDYVRIFAHTDPTYAASYFYIFYKRLEKREEKEAIYFRSIRDLIIEGKDISVLLGQVESNEMVKKGFLEKYLSSDDFLALLESCAKEYKAIGRYRDAVELYFRALKYHISLLTDLSTDHQDKSTEYLYSILNIMIDELSQVLSGGENRDEVKQSAQKVFETFTGDNIIINKINQSTKLSSALRTFKILVKLTKVFDSFMNRNYERTLSELKELKIIPFELRELEEKVQKFKELDEKIQKKISDILFVAMSTLCHLYTSPKTYTSQQIKDMSNCIMSFAGENQNMISKDVNSHLITFQNRIGK